MDKVFVVIATSGEYEDVWRRPVAVSPDRARLEEFIRVSDERNKRFNLGVEFLIEFLETLESPEWSSEDPDESDRIYEEWEEKVKAPAIVAFLLTKGFTAEEAKLVPEYPEDSIHYRIEEVPYIS